MVSHAFEDIGRTDRADDCQDDRRRPDFGLQLAETHKRTKIRGPNEMAERLRGRLGGERGPPVEAALGKRYRRTGPDAGDEWMMVVQDDGEKRHVARFDVGLRFRV